MSGNLFNWIDKAFDYFDNKRENEIREITRKKQLAENRYALSQLLRILVSEKKRRQYGAQLFGGDDEYNRICDDIELLHYILNKSEYYQSADELFNNHREDLEYIYNTYSNYLGL